MRFDWLASWRRGLSQESRTCGNLADSLGIAQRIRRSTKRRKDWDAGPHQRTELLEERVMMSLDSLADQPLPTSGAPMDVATGLINADGFTDLVALTDGGQVTVALNSGDDRWGSVSTIDLHSLAAGSWTASKTSSSAARTA